jgi:hypothetical protein
MGGYGSVACFTEYWQKETTPTGVFLDGHSRTRQLSVTHSSDTNPNCPSAPVDLTRFKFAHKPIGRIQTKLEWFITRIFVSASSFV